MSEKIQCFEEFESPGHSLLFLNAGKPGCQILGEKV